MVSISTVHRTVGKSWKLLEGYNHRTINAMLWYARTPTGEETAHKQGRREYDGGNCRRAVDPIIIITPCQLQTHLESSIIME